MSKPETLTERGSSLPAESEEARLLATVRGLVLELHPHMQRSLSVRLDSDLDNDLGLDSLGRAEVVHRLEREFGVQLPERLIGEAVRVADLKMAVENAAPGARGKIAAPAVIHPAVLPGTEAPVHATTLLEAFAAHVAAHPDRLHLYLWQDDDTEVEVTYGALDAGARAIAGGLIAHGIEPGDRVAIMLPTELAFFQSFLGVQMAGAVPVPIYPPFRRAQIEEHLRRQAGILRNAEAAVLITSPEIHSVATLLYGLADSLRKIETADALLKAEPLPAALPADPDSTALIQYTSGSTGDPKGVVLSHANLIANIRGMGEALEASSEDVFASWLPLYHDMGLIGAWLACLYFGAPTAIMPPLTFLASPKRWLWSIHRHRATLSAAPNFAFDLCVRNIRDADIEGLDLSSWRMVINGAEPISPATLKRFSERFGPYGFKPGTMAPSYGLAEDAVGLAFPPPGRVPIIDRVSRTELTRNGLAVPARAEDAAALEFVACGRPMPRHEVRILDASGHELPERQEGRLQFRGPSATRGYFRDEARTKALIVDGWLESGDRAYIANGDIFITGRIKDMIKRAGRNIYPQELEELVGTLEGVRKGCVVAFASRDTRSETERLVILAETRYTDPERRDALKRRIIEASMATLDLPPDEVVLAPPRTVPKTSSGKLRRSSAREMYEKGLLTQPSRALWLQLLRLGASGFAHTLRRAMRVAAEWLYAGWWWALLAAMAALSWLLVLLVPVRRWRHAIINRAAKAFLWLAGIPLEITAEAPPPRDHVLFVVNHSSYLDAPVVTAALEGPMAFVAKQELERQWVAGLFLKRIGTLFVRRGSIEGGLEDVDDQLKAALGGERLVSFPEGTLTRMPGLLAFHLGPFHVAVQAKIPVVPVAIRGTRHVLRGDQWFPRRGRIKVHIGTPIVADGTGFDAAVRLRDKARAQILANCGEPDLVRERVRLPS